jgi:cobalt/nickel transport system permease protein
MVGWHLAIGIGEAIITAVVLGAIIATRPDVVYIARPLLVGQNPASQEPARPRSSRSIVGIGLAVSLIVGGGVSLLASANPDGLEYAAESLGFLDSATESAATMSPFAEYAFLGDGGLGSSLAGLVGVLLTLAVTFAIAMVLRLRGLRTTEPATTA